MICRVCKDLERMWFDFLDLGCSLYVVRTGVSDALIGGEVLFFELRLVSTSEGEGDLQRSQ